MIGYLQGELLDLTDGRFLIGVGALGTGQVGYDVSVPARVDYLEKEKGETLSLFIHTHVREDALDLYGFLSAGERELFLTLLSMSGIGPKLGVGILSNADPSRLISAIMDKDKEFLGQIPGIGKKTLERLLLELTDPIRKKLDQGRFGLLNPILGGRRSAAVSAIGRSGPALLIRDAQIALIGLGYREQELSPVLERICLETSPKKVEDLIRSTLKELASPNVGGNA